MIRTSAIIDELQSILDHRGACV